MYFTPIRAAEKERQDTLMLDKIPSRTVPTGKTVGRKASTGKKNTSSSTARRQTKTNARGYDDQDYVSVTKIVILHLYTYLYFCT